VVWLNTNEEVNVIARYAPWDGLYMVSVMITQASMISMAATIVYIDDVKENSTDSITVPLPQLDP
jgi:hypothetical protein